MQSLSSLFKVSRAGELSSRDSIQIVWAVCPSQHEAAHEQRKSLLLFFSQSEAVSPQQVDEIWQLSDEFIMFFPSRYNL